MPCSYNSSQACGGEYFYSIWRIALCMITFISVFFEYKSKENERLTYLLVNVSFEILKIFSGFQVVSFFFIKELFMFQQGRRIMNPGILKHSVYLIYKIYFLLDIYFN